MLAETLLKENCVDSHVQVEGKITIDVVARRVTLVPDELLEEAAHYQVRARRPV